MWETINRVLNKDTQPAALSNISKDGEAMTKDYDIFEALSYYFVSIKTRPLAMEWHGVANDTSGQQDAIFLPAPKIFLQFFIVPLSL